MKKVLGIDDKDGIIIPGILLEKIGIGISECPICMSIHNNANTLRKDNSNFMVKVISLEQTMHLRQMIAVYNENRDTKWVCPMLY